MSAFGRDAAGRSNDSRFLVIQEVPCIADKKQLAAGRQVRRQPQNGPHYQQQTRPHGFTTLQVGAADFVLFCPKTRFNDQV